MVKKILTHIPFGYRIIAFIQKFITANRLKHKHKINFGSKFGKLMFQGQFYQDIIAYLYFKREYPQKTDGFFVDIGAHDGITLSNTYIFEQLGWKGICVEPQPDVFISLKSSCKCDCYNVAISSKSREKAEFFQVGADVLSGLNEGMTEERKKWTENYGGKGKIINVRTITFNELMEKYPQKKHIDLLSIDVEGHDIEILKTIDFKRYSFGFLTIEKNDSDKIIEHMRQNGYEIYAEIGVEIMFIPEKM